MMRLFSLLKSVVFLLLCRENPSWAIFVLILFENNVVSGDDENSKTLSLRRTDGNVNRKPVGS